MSEISKYSPLPREKRRIILDPADRAVVESNLRRAARFFAAKPEVQRGSARVMEQLKDVIDQGLNGAAVVGIDQDGKIF